MRSVKWIAVAAVLVIVPGAASAQAVVSERTLSYAAALEMATAALEQCRKDGYKVTITVLNRAGRTKVVVHDDGANPHTLENSLRKAYTSLTFRVPSGDFGKRIVANPQATGALHLDKITTLEGALPIVSKGEVIGAIGISGAPGGEKDAKCAQVGIDRIAGGLQ
jgi:uncharacterized protein GlcG (DUF336 family)